MKVSRTFPCWLWLLFFALASCGRDNAPSPVVFYAEGYPEKLSDWNVLSAGNGVLTLNADAVPYDLATPLFSDYASKLRTITLPAGTSAAYDPENEFALPVGTVISKTFYYPTAGAQWPGAVVDAPAPTVNEGAMPLGGVRLIETRLLVHRAEGWVAIPYVWNEDQSDAAHPANASWTDETASLDARARAYLDINCSHCHSDVGPADTSGLDLRPGTPMGPAFGWCKSVIAAGGGSGGRPYDIVPGKPEQSIFVYRLETTKPGHMMPELGRAVTHMEGVKLIADWIAALEGDCA